MAQPKLARLSLDLAQMHSDGLNDAGIVLTDYTQNGQRLSAQQRVTAINYARDLVFYKYYISIKNPRVFADLFPEYVGIASLNIAAIPEGVLMVLNFTANNVTWYPISANQYSESVNNQYSVYHHTKGNFFVNNGNVLTPTKEIVPSGSPTTNYQCVYLKSPVPAVIDSTSNGLDIPDRNLITEIMQEAFKKATEFLNFQ